ncbi:hypothetical protein AB4Y64_02775 [Lysobacter sp. TAF61]|uniref:hypothetical protein n=1 Tax=Lysobacter sp. TAF61 TaxID=3233072 RepID=UPI003F98ED44
MHNENTLDTANHELNKDLDELDLWLEKNPMTHESTKRRLIPSGLLSYGFDARPKLTVKGHRVELWLHNTGSDLDRTLIGREDAVELATALVEVCNPADEGACRTPTVREACNRHFHVSGFRNGRVIIQSDSAMVQTDRLGAHTLSCQLQFAALACFQGEQHGA